MGDSDNQKPKRKEKSCAASLFAKLNEHNQPKEILYNEHPTQCDLDAK